MIAQNVASNINPKNTITVQSSYLMDTVIGGTP
jgi:hypothetical protein